MVLARYDGFSVQYFQASTHDSTSLSGNNLSSIAEDNLGRLWIGTTNAGLNYSNPEKNKFQNFGDHYFANDELSTKIFDIAVDGLNRIWVTGNRGLQILQEENGVFLCLSISDFTQVRAESIDSLGPKILHLDDLNKMWIGCTQGACMIDLSSNTVNTPILNSHLPSDVIDDIHVDKNGVVWMSRKSEESRFIYFSEESLRYGLFNELPILSARSRVHFTFDMDNRLWAASFGQGLYGFDLRSNEIFLQNDINSSIVEERFIRRPFSDRDGNIWIPGYGVL